MKKILSVSKQELQRRIKVEKRQKNGKTWPSEEGAGLAARLSTARTLNKSRTSD